MGTDLSGRRSSATIVAVLGKLPKAVADALKARERPAIIVGGGALRRGRAWRGAGAGRQVQAGRETGWNGFNVLHFAAARMGGLMLGLRRRAASPTRGGQAQAAARARRGRSGFQPSSPTRFKVYIGHHGDKGAHAADIDPAGRGLYREGRHLRQHRRPRAVCRQGRVRAGRCARGLDDPARAGRCAGRFGAASTASTNCAPR